MVGSEVVSDMVSFIWHTLSEPIVAAFAIATAITICIVIASYFTFLLNSKEKFYHDR